LPDVAARVPSARLLPIFDAAERASRDPLVGLHSGARVETRGPLFYLLHQPHDRIERCARVLN